MRPLTAVAVVIAVALPWYVAVDRATHGQWLQQFFQHFNVQPFREPSYGHAGPFYYHFLVIFVGFFPWSMFLGRTLLDTYRGVRGREAARPGYVLLSCWVAVFFLFWSACSTKLPHYVLPAYPALAMLTAAFLVHCARPPATCMAHGCRWRWRQPLWWAWPWSLPCRW